MQERHPESRRRPRRLPAVLLAGALLVGCGKSPEQMLASAKDYLKKEDYNAAVIQLKNALQENRDLAEARFLLGRIYFEQGDFAGAVKELQYAVSLGYEDEAVVPMLARALLSQGRRKDVIETYTGKALDDPKALSELLTALGDARLSENRDEAARDYREALKADADNALARLGLVRILVLDEKPEEALESLDAILAEAPALGLAHALQAQALFQVKRFDDGVEAIRRAIEVAPDDQQYRFMLVSSLVELDRAEEARAALAAMEADFAATPAVRYLRAYLDFRADRVTEARDGIQQVVRAAPDYLPARLLAGAIFYRLNDHVQAQQNLNRVLESRRDSMAARRLLVMSYLAQRDAARAVDVLEPLLATHPNEPEVLVLAGQTYLLAGDFERSSQYYARHVESAPGDARALTRLGVSRLAGGEVTEGLNDLDVASKLDSSQGYADFARVTALLRERRFDEALAAQEELEAKLPNNPLSYNLRGGILLGKGDVAGARSAFEKALEIDATFLPAATNLARLDFREGRIEQARAVYRTMLERKANPAAVHLAIAELEKAAGSGREVIRGHYQAAVDAAPQMLAPKLHFAEFLLAIDAPAEALAVVREAQAIDADHPSTLKVLGHALMATQDLQQALSAFQARAELQPGNAEAQLDVGRALLMTGQLRPAEQALRKALSLRETLVDVYRLLITIQLRDKRFDESLELARRLQALAPKSGLGHVFEGDVHAAREDWKAALPVFRTAFELSPNSMTVVKLHAALVRNDRGGEADKLEAQWFEDHPNDMTMVGYMAEHSLATDQAEKAYRLYSRLNEATPDRALVLNNLAWLAARMNDAKALAYGRRALELQPENPAILDTVAMIQLGQGETAEAVGKLEKAAQLAPQSPAIKLNLAKGYIKAGRKDEARELLNALSGEYPPGHRLHEEAVALRATL